MVRCPNMTAPYIWVPAVPSFCSTHTFLDVLDILEHLYNASLCVYMCVCISLGDNHGLGLMLSRLIWQSTELVDATRIMTSWRRPSKGVMTNCNQRSYSPATHHISTNIQTDVSPQHWQPQAVPCIEYHRECHVNKIIYQEVFTTLQSGFTIRKLFTTRI